MHRKFPPPKKGKTRLMMQNVFACKILYYYPNVYMKKKNVVLKDSHINIYHLRKTNKGPVIIYQLGGGGGGGGGGAGQFFCKRGFQSLTPCR